MYCPSCGTKLCKRKEEYVKEVMFYRTLYECLVCRGKFEFEETIDQVDETKLYFNWKESE